MSTDTVSKACETSSPAPRPDWGDMNRELLARRLRAAFVNGSPSTNKDASDAEQIELRWLHVADVAIEVIQESP